MTEPVVVAILAKDKEYCLPLFLQSIYNQTYPKNLIHLYIRTNDNKDKTAEVLADWLEAHQKEYASTTAIFDSVDETLKEYGEHQWNPHRYDILAKIRQASVDFAKSIGAHYFVADCDNFVVPETLANLFKNRHLGVIAPLLETPILYSNYHHCATENGYYKKCDEYSVIRNRKIKGVFQVDVVHCAYFIPNHLLNKVVYSDETSRMEYAIFSHWLRLNKVPQYIDNTIDYGFLVNPYPEDSVKEFKMCVMGGYFHKYKDLFNPTTPEYAKYLLTLFDF